MACRHDRKRLYIRVIPDMPVVSAVGMLNGSGQSATERQSWDSSDSLSPPAPHSPCCSPRRVAPTRAIRPETRRRAWARTARTASPRRRRPRRCARVSGSSTWPCPQPYTPAAPNGGTDEYRCFVVDPKLTEPAYLTGSRFLPQNADIVHHAIFYRLSPEQAKSAAQVDAAQPGRGLDLLRRRRRAGGDGLGRALGARRRRDAHAGRLRLRDAAGQQARHAGALQPARRSPARPPPPTGPACRCGSRTAARR